MSHLRGAAGTAAVCNGAISRRFILRRLQLCHLCGAAETGTMLRLLFKAICLKAHCLKMAHLHGASGAAAVGDHPHVSQIGPQLCLAT